MSGLLNHLVGAFKQTTQRRPVRQKREVRPRLEVLEDRQMPAVLTDMTAVAQLFPRHAGPTMLYLNFDGYTGQNVSAFQSTTGNLKQDIHDILYRTAQLFAPFDVQVRRIGGNGVFSNSNGNTTVFIGDDSDNGTGTANGSYAGTFLRNCDYPGDILGVKHRPNSNTFDLTYVDPVGSGGNWSNTQIAQAIAHEAGHTFGLAHIRTVGTDPSNLGSGTTTEMMSYDSANVLFRNSQFNITTWNNNSTSITRNSNLQPKWYTTTTRAWWLSDNTIPNNITTQNSYTYLQAVLGRRDLAFDDYGNVADSTTVDASWSDGVKPPLTMVSSRAGSIEREGDFDVFKYTATTSSWMQIDVKADPYTAFANLKQLNDSVVSIYNSNGTLVAFDDDSGDGFWSRVSFYATAGQTYNIVVGGYQSNNWGHYLVTSQAYYTDTGSWGLAGAAMPASSGSMVSSSGSATPTARGSRVGSSGSAMGFSSGSSGDTLGLDSWALAVTRVDKTASATTANSNIGLYECFGEDWRRGLEKRIAYDGNISKGDDLIWSISENRLGSDNTVMSTLDPVPEKVDSEDEVVTPTGDDEWQKMLKAFQEYWLSLDGTTDPCKELEAFSANFDFPPNPCLV